MTDAPADVSTTLETTTPAMPSGGGVVTPEPEAPKETLRDTIADELKRSTEPKEPAKDDTDATKGADGDKDGEAKGKADKADKGDAESKKEKQADDVKPTKARDDSGKFKAKEPEGDGDDPKVNDAKPEKELVGREKQLAQSVSNAPRNFMPDAKEKWANTPQPVRREIDMMLQRHEAELTQAKATTARYESIRPFDELAKSNGRDLTESLTKMAQIEDLMQANPYAGLNAILQEIGPKKPDGSTPSLFEVAQFITQAGPEKWQQIVGARPQAVNDQSNDEVAALKRQVSELQAQQKAGPVIEKFKAEHPRYDELKGDIAFFLQSGKVPIDLSADERLAQAYDMAVRINPASHVESADPSPALEPERRAETDLSGTKSIKSAPGSVSNDHAPKRGGSIADILRDEMRRKKTA